MTDSSNPPIRNSHSHDLEEHTDLADVIRHAMFKIKSDQCNNNSHCKKNYTFPCPVWEKNCNKNQQSSQCSLCENWVHRKCNGITKAQFDILVEEDDDIPFHCIMCNIKNNEDIFPFGFLSKSELLDLHGTDMSSQLAMLPSFTVHSKLSKIPNLSNFDTDKKPYLYHKLKILFISRNQ